MQILPTVWPDVTPGTVSCLLTAIHVFLKKLLVTLL